MTKVEIAVYGDSGTKTLHQAFEYPDWISATNDAEMLMEVFDRLIYYQKKLAEMRG